MALATTDDHAARTGAPSRAAAPRVLLVGTALGVGRRVHAVRGPHRRVPDRARTPRSPPATRGCPRRR